jgi:hypothetical protein
MNLLVGYALATSQAAAAIWPAIATIKGKTRFADLGNFDLKREPPSGTVLMVQRQQTTHTAWTPVPCLWVEDHRIYFSPDLTNPCKN